MDCKVIDPRLHITNEDTISDYVGSLSLMKQLLVLLLRSKVILVGLNN